MKIRLTSVQRRLLSRTFLIGAILTLAVVIVEQFKMLEALERYFYDRRAAYFQYFTPKPSPDIVFVSIDDATLSDIGRWPWPREYLSLIVDELHEAGARVIALDIIMPEPQEPRWVPLDADQSQFAKIEDDKLLGDSFANARNVLLAATAGDFETKTIRPVYQALKRILAQDLEQTTEDAERSLAAVGYSKDEITTAIQEDYLPAFEDAAFDRLREVMGRGVTTLDIALAQLAPRDYARQQRSNATVLIEQVYRRVDAIRRLERFSQPLPSNIGSLLRAVTRTTLAPVSQLTNGAAFSGYVDFLKEDDGIVRSIPLIAEFEGRAFPHMALATACAALHVPFSSVRIERDRIVVPLPSERGGDIVIPVRTIDSNAHGEKSGFLDMAWFGLREPYWSMYDYPNHVRPVQQDSLKNLWRIEEFRRSLGKNSAEALDAIKILLDQIGENAQPIVDEWPTANPARRVEMIRSVLANTTVQDFYAPTTQALEPGETLDEGSLLFKNAVEALRGVIANDGYIQNRIVETREKLRKDLNNKIVVVGWTAAGQYDYYPTSLHAQCPGVMIQGVALNNILTRDFWVRAPVGVTPLVTILMGGLITVIVAVLPSYRALIATIIVGLGYFALNGLVFFDYMDRIVPVAGGLTACVVVWGILTLYRYIFESAERTRITSRFSGYVDPAIVNLLVEDPDKVNFAGELREMTVVFTDLAGFTTISEKLQERTVRLLNDYMARMMPIIRRNSGTWNKFLGDGIMFFYNAPKDDPEHARHAIITVLEMLAVMKPFNDDLAKQDLPSVAMRAGITTGPMIAGDAGSITATDPQYAASDYTVLGDNVNLAARLESANKALGSQLLCVERTIELMGDGILFRPLARLQVVGKTTGVLTFEPMCFEKDATDEQRLLAVLSRDIVDAYVEKRFADCIAAAERMEAAFGKSKFTKLYIGHAKEYLVTDPGEDFDGTIVLEAK